jgi:hypothetical protein
MVDVQAHEVVGLQQHVAELGVGNSLFRALKSGLDRLLGHHLVHREVLADVAQEVQHGHLAQPQAVVEEKGVRQIEELGELRTDALQMLAEHLFGEHGPLVQLPSGIPDHPGPTAGQRNGPVSSQLEASQGAQLEHVPHMQAVGGGVEAGIDRHAPGVEPLEEGGVGHLVNQATKGEVLRERGHRQTLPYATSLVIA